jgi:hypothetical protein
MYALPTYVLPSIGCTSVYAHLRENRMERDSGQEEMQDGWNMLLLSPAAQPATG